MSCKSHHKYDSSVKPVLVLIRELQLQELVAKIPEGFVLDYLHQCPESDTFPDVSGKWVATIYENRPFGRRHSGYFKYYSTPKGAVHAATLTVKRILKERTYRPRKILK